MTLQIPALTLQIAQRLKISELAQINNDNDIIIYTRNNDIPRNLQSKAWFFSFGFQLSFGFRFQIVSLQTNALLWRVTTLLIKAEKTDLR